MKETRRYFSKVFDTMSSVSDGHADAQTDGNYYTNIVFCLLSNADARFPDPSVLVLVRALLLTRSR